MIPCRFTDKDRELTEAQAEIKALRLSERLREKAVEEVLCSFDDLLSLVFLLFKCCFIAQCEHPIRKSLQHFPVDCRVCERN